MNSEIIIHGKKKDLGGFSVFRSLPTIHCRSVGPFVFLDHMGPMQVDETHHLDVRPHPHIGLMTVTYLLEGKGYHRDSIGSKQIINPGDINLMIAGKGIVHSERTPEEEKNHSNKKIHGLQIWLALPKEDEECDPAFFHYSKEQLPKITVNESISIDLLIGSYQQYQSAVKSYFKTLFLVANIKNNTKHEFTFNEKEIGILIISGAASINDQELKSNDFIKVGDPQNIKFFAKEDCELAIVGGETLPEPRFMWWNLISTRKELIHLAAKKWKNQEMGKVDGETDFIPLPNDPLP